MRLGILLAFGVTLLGVTLHRINRIDACDLVSHDPHWVTPTLRVCRRPGCHATWRRDPGDIAATTTNQPGGW